jgi:hypothetical protein
MKQNDWLRDPIWQFLGVVVGAAVSIALAVIGPITLPDRVRLVVVIMVVLGAVLCLILVLRRGFGASNQSPGLTVPKPQARHSSDSQAQQTAHDDPIVLGGGWDTSWRVVFIGGLLLIIGVVIDVRVTLSPDTNAGANAVVFFLGIGILFLSLMILVRSLFMLIFGPRECLKIGSEGIDYYKSRAHRFFIPWNEISRVYIASNTLYVELKSLSRLHFLKPIKWSYSNGVFVICGISDNVGSDIPKYLVQFALDIYTPSGVERSRK